MASKYRQKYKAYNKEYRLKNKAKISIYNKQWQKNNPEKVKAIQKKHHQKYKERYNQQNKERYWNNREKKLACNKKYKEKNKEKLKEYRKNFYQKNRERLRKSARRYRLNHLEAERKRDRENKRGWTICVDCGGQSFGSIKRKRCNKCRLNFLRNYLKGNQYWKKVNPQNRPKGENHPLWRGGLTFWKKRIWDSLKYKNWRQQVFERDNFTCQGCGIKGGYLEAHHLQSFTDLLRKYNVNSREEADKCDALWDIGLGQTLCFKCHQPTKNGNPKHKKK